ncbi:RbsD/FucU family protein [Phycisphaerales bacterium AB-hyl4]|uniref:RbsD/FucU family protein n=1 Tax=Natronomicrosphaera hydrolytica TaxID=3242702 RepID=A0ABV4U3N6_9BACT
MLKSRLIHPQLLDAIGRAGHGSQVLIADGNYPAATKLGPNARLVHLNLSPGLVSCTQVLEALLPAVPVEAAATMDYARTGPYGLSEDPPIWDEYRGIFRTAGYADLKLKPIERFAFYEAGESPDVAVTIQTGEQRIYANLLLTLGVVMGD